MKASDIFEKIVLAIFSFFFIIVYFFLSLSETIKNITYHFTYIHVYLLLQKVPLHPHVCTRKLKPHEILKLNSKYIIVNLTDRNSHWKIYYVIWVFIIQSIHIRKNLSFILSIWYLYRVKINKLVKKVINRLILKCQNERITKSYLKSALYWQMN